MKSFLANTSKTIAKIKGIVIQQTILPIHLLNKSIFVINDAIHFGISSGIFSEPFLRSAIISSEISSLVGSSAIVTLKKIKRTVKSALFIITFLVF